MAVIYLPFLRLEYINPIYIYILLLYIIKIKRRNALYDANSKSKQHGQNNEVCTHAQGPKWYLDWSRDQRDQTAAQNVLRSKWT